MHTYPIHQSTPIRTVRYNVHPNARTVRKPRRRLKKAVRVTLEYAAVILADLLIYALWLRPMAVADRGTSDLIGGELFFLILFPLLWAMAKAGFRDVRAWLRGEV